MNDPKSCDKISHLTSGYSLPKFNLRFLFAAIGFSALWLGLYAWCHPASRIVTAVMSLTYLFGCERTKRACRYVVPSLYLPHTWIFWIPTPWDAYRKDWAAMFFQMPGIVAEALVHPTSNLVFEAITGAATTILFLTSVTFGRPGKNWLAITCLAVGCASVVSAIFNYAVFNA